MNRAGLLIGLVAATSGAAIVGLFWVQNSARMTQLSLNLGFAAWELGQPVQVPALIAIAFALGLALGAVPLWLRSLTLNRRVRRLEQELAVASTTTSTSPASTNGWR